MRVLAVDAFRQLGAATNDRYAWSAQSSDRSITVLTLWEDEVTDDGEMVRADFMAHPKLDVWKDQRRNVTRKRHLLDVWNGDRQFRVVMLRAKDISAIPRATAARWPEENLTMTLEAFDPDTGAFRAVGMREGGKDRKSGERWSRDELEACVKAYRSLWLAQQAGVPMAKSTLRAAVLQNELKIRKPAAYEKRMQNISSVVQELGLGFVQGYPPLHNIGSPKVLLIEMVNRQWDRMDDPEKPTDDAAAFATRVQSASLKLCNSAPPPLGQKIVALTSSTHRQFVRDPNVAAWVCLQAKGVCEACGKAAPFLRENGEPYLEVHHVRPLAEGGPDTIDNTVAVCPDCHRRLHHGADRKTFRGRMISSVPRLSNYPRNASASPANGR